MNGEILKVLTNKEAIAVNQDKLGISCLLWKKLDNGVEVWLKPMADGGFALCFLNRNGSAADIDFNCQQVATDPDFNKSYSIDGSYSVHDIWGNKDLGTTTSNIKASIKGHDVLFVRLKKK